MFRGIFNHTPETYLSTVSEPKLLLCCGHLVNHAKYYHTTADDGKDLRGQEMHEHLGWYTVDKDICRCPDLIADLEDEHTLRYLSDTFRGRLKVIYVEGWSFHSINFHKMAYETLKPGGVLIYSLGPNKTPGHIRELKDILSSAGFNLDHDHLYFFHNPFTEISRYGLRRAIMQFPNVNTIEEIDNRALMQKLIETTDGDEGRNKFLYKIYFATGVIPKFMDHLKKLSHIDPFLGWGLSYTYDR